MDLILWRHCEAAPGVPDDARVLTPRGLEQASRIARWLTRHLPDRCRVLVSPAVRAQQTAGALNRPFETIAEAGTDTTVPKLLAAARWPASREAVLIVGHQPTLGRIAAFLVAGKASDWAVATGAVWWLANRSREKDSSVAVRAAVDPDLL